MLLNLYILKNNLKYGGKFLNKNELCSIIGKEERHIVLKFHKRNDLFSRIGIMGKFESNNKELFSINKKTFKNYFNNINNFSILELKKLFNFKDLNLKGF